MGACTETGSGLDIKPECPQLFVDDHLIDTMSGITPVLHQPEKVPPEQAAEVRSTPAVPGGVVTPRELGHYSFPALPHTDESGRAADPPAWTFSPADIPGMYDPRTPTRRPIHVRFCWEARGEEGYGLHRAVSYDGADWGPLAARLAAAERRSGRVPFLFWDYRKGCLVDMVRMGSNYPHGRTMGRGESPDFGLHWTPPVRVLTEDADDPEDTQVYNVEAGIYAGVYLAVVHLYRTESRTLLPAARLQPRRVPVLPFPRAVPAAGPRGRTGGRHDLVRVSRVRRRAAPPHLFRRSRDPQHAGPLPAVQGAAYLRKDGFVSLDAGDHLGRWSPGRSAARRGTPFRWTARCRCS